LITNAEWTTIARNSELLTINWNSSVVGSGFMFSGHTDNSAGALSVSNVSDYYDQTGNSNVSGANQKRVLILNNSEVIWDLGGNVWEWNNDTCSQGDPWYTIAGYVEWSDPNLQGAGKEKELAGPFGDYTSTNGAGEYWGCDTVGNGFLRGAFYNNGATVIGVYTLYLDLAPSYTDPAGVGFRCAYTP
jgi:hypothetical protein